MASRLERVEELQRLLMRNGGVLGEDNQSVQLLNDWFVNHIEADGDGPPGFLAADWQSVCHDVAMFLGELMIHRHRSLEWALHTWGGKRNVCSSKP